MHYGWRLARLGFLLAGILTCSASYALEEQPGTAPTQAIPQNPYAQPVPQNPSVMTPGAQPQRPTVVISSATRPVLETFNGLPAVLTSRDTQLYREVFALQHKGKRVSVVSTLATQPPMVADELRRQADQFIDIADLQDEVFRDPAERQQRDRASNDEALVDVGNLAEEESEEVIET